VILREGAICTPRQIIEIVDRLQDIEDEEAMIFLAVKKGTQTSARGECDHNWESQLCVSTNFAFGSIHIHGSTYEHDVIIDRGEIRKRKKKPSKQFRNEFGHTPLSAEEIPWKCGQLVIGTGAYGKLPVMQEVMTRPSVKRSSC
jgi:hypothetical protein